MTRYHEDLLEYCFKILRLIGANPLDFKDSVAAGAAVVILIKYYLIFYGLLFEPLDYVTMTDYVQSCCVVNSGVIKAVSIRVMKAEIVELLKNMEQCWSVQHFGTEEIHATFQEFLARALVKVKRIFKKWMNFVYVLACCTTSTALLSGGLPLPCFQPSVYTALCYYATYVIDVFFVFYGITASMGTEMIFITAIFLLVVQFKILNRQFRHLDYKDQGLEIVLRKCIQHHNFLYRQIDLVERISSAMLFLYLWNVVGAMCIVLFSLHQGFNGGVLVNCITMLFYVLEIVLIYFVPSQLLTDEAGQVIKNVYFSSWYECTDMSVRKSLSIVMTRGQREVALTAGNFMLMNLETCTSLFKTTFSFNTFLQNMTEDI